MRDLLRATAVVATMSVFASPVHGAGVDQSTFTRVAPQYIAALGDPSAKSGNNAQTWGLWRVDPGPRGVPLTRYQRLIEVGGVAPSNWRFDSRDWWLEEHGLIMEKPTFPLAAGKYLVTGDREVTAVLTVYRPDKDGNQRWELSDGAKLYDVTHLACRSARYTPATSPNACSPANAPKSEFRVAPGRPMPPVEGCNKQDYAVLIVIGVASEHTNSTK
ncbi:MAG TPA: hypothetical protein VL693_21585 [Vicinamibacterales bacterium]|jgi:hypothetical protein|nr:hypothetical protein [Vicinamibacterales bacterium]